MSNDAIGLLLAGPFALTLIIGFIGEFIIGIKNEIRRIKQESLMKSRKEQLKKLKAAKATLQ